MSTTLDYARELLGRRSITPGDAGCQPLIAGWLAKAGFKSQDYSEGEVRNTLYTHAGGNFPQRPHLLLLGHTDVVPPGPAKDWSSDPFQPAERDGLLYARGAADMKGAVAAMVSALQQFVADQPDHPGRLSLLLTSDEEGPAVHGVRAAAPALAGNDLLPDYCLVGEPSSIERLGDNIRVGRRGSIHARLRFPGRQGHTAYAAPADNPVHRALPALAALCAHRFDEADDRFPATLLHVSNISAGTGADNITPGELEVRLNIRNHPATPAAAIEQTVRGILGRHGLGDCRLDWDVRAEPYATPAGELLAAVDDAITERLGQHPVHDTGGGTSDGRFFAALGAQVVELGLVNASIHQVDEHVRIADLDELRELYLAICRRLLGPES